MRSDRLLATVAIAGLGAAMLTACGIPASSSVESVEEAPTEFDSGALTAADAYRPTTEARGTVENFLKAASGDPGGRDNRLLAFTDDEVEFSDPGDGVGLLEGASLDLDMGERSTTASVTVTGSVFATYLPDGQVRLSSSPRSYEEVFQLQRSSVSDVWTIAELPSQVVMLYSQFKIDYEPATLYFPVIGQADLLVPDLRWIYDGLGADKDRDLRLQWLLEGPSEWILHTARRSIPTSVSAGAATLDDGTVIIDLTQGESAAITAEMVEPITAQIAWSLGLGDDFELRIDREVVDVSQLADWRGWNAIPEETDEAGYYVSDETVWQFEGSEISDTAAARPWVGLYYPGLVEVAVDHGSIAAVYVDGNTRRLAVGHDEESMEPVDGFGARSVRDPQWILDDTVLAVVNGVITAINVSTGGAQELWGEEVTALSVAADARRLAYVEGGRASVVPLTHDVDGNLTIGQARRIGADISGVTDVAWSAENWILVAGERAGTDDRLFRVSIDNAETEAQAGTASLPQASEIAARPADPLQYRRRGEPTVAVIGGDLYRVHSTNLQRIEDGRSGEAVPGTAPFTVLD